MPRICLMRARCGVGARIVRIAGVARAVSVGVMLVRVWVVGAHIVPVRHMVPVPVAVAGVPDAIAVLVFLVRVGVVYARVVPVLDAVMVLVAAGGG
jgi:hypothetical protein